MGIYNTPSARLRRLRRGLVSLVGLAAFLLPGLAGAAADAAAAAAGGAKAAVPTVVAQAGGRAVSGRLDGVLQPQRQATLAAQLGGSVLALSVKAGDRVRAGQVLARIDERDTQAGLQRSDAGLAQAEAEARNARLQAERLRELRAQGFVSQAALDQAETALKAAQSGVDQARAGRQQALLARGFASVTAPFDAVVLATHVEAGDLAAPGRAIATVYAPGALRAVVQVPASQAAAARAARNVGIELPDGRRVAPRAQLLLPGTDAVSQTVEWRLDLAVADAAAGLLPGQAVRVLFDAPQDAGAAAGVPGGGGPLVLPAAALLRRGELTAVYVVQQGRFVLRAVRAGAARGPGVEVLAGLKAGERVAADAVAAGLAGAVPAP